MISTTIIIPARYNSKRFPGKLLSFLGDKTILQHVYFNCLEVELVSKVVIATDDDRIKAHCLAEDMDFVMTNPNHTSGTDRIAEAVKLLNITSDYIINVQGDEPFLHKKELNILSNLLNSRNADIASLYQEKSGNYVDTPNEVKVATTIDGQALYFSRSMIPYMKVEEQKSHKVHIGVYGFKRDVLMEITKLPQSELEMQESLEQLRWLENGYKVILSKTEYNAFGIDTKEDLEKARKLIAL